VSTIQERLGLVAATSLRARAVDSDVHRRACAVIAAAAASVATKQETARTGIQAASTTSTVSESVSGCNAECA
jgi:hypothetical protein